MTQALNLANFANTLNTSGQTSNSGLQNSSVTVSAGTGMSGGGAVALGNSVTLNNAGVTSLTAGTGISLSGSTGGVTITNSAPATSYTAGNGISISSGSIALGVPTNSTVGTYTAGNIGYVNISIGTTTAGSSISYSNSIAGPYSAFNYYDSTRGNASIGVSGTWRACTPTTTVSVTGCCGPIYYGSSALWIRIA